MIASDPGRTNIIFIIVDDMGYADLGCHGSGTIKTAGIDAMAREGMRFTQAYSGCTVCGQAAGGSSSRLDWSAFNGPDRLRCIASNAWTGIFRSGLQGENRPSRSRAKVQQ